MPRRPSFAPSVLPRKPPTAKSPTGLQPRRRKRKPSLLPNAAPASEPRSSPDLPRKNRVSRTFRSFHSRGVTIEADSETLTAALLEHGYARLGRLLSVRACSALRALYGDEKLFRSTIDMERFRFGRGRNRLDACWR